MQNMLQQGHSTFIRLFSRFGLIGLAMAILLVAHVSAQNINYTENNLDQALRGNANVDPTTLNMSFSVALNNYPGRGVSLPISLNYASKLWRIQFRNTVQASGTTFTDTLARYAEHSVAGWTASLDPVWTEYTTQAYDSGGQPDCRDCPGYSGTSYWIGRVVVHLPNGETHELRKENEAPVFGANPPAIGGIYVAVDGSRIKLDASASTYVVYLPDGGRYLLYTPNGSVFPPTNNIDYLDRHGNKLSYSYATRKWTDTLGRQIGLVDNATGVYALDNSTETTRSAMLPGVGGTWLQYQFVWKKLSQVVTGGPVADTSMYYVSNTVCNPQQTTNPAPYLFNNLADVTQRVCSGSRHNPIVLAEIILPNGKKYTFNYNYQGEIEKIFLPTGGTSRYAYAQIAALDSDVSGDPLYSQANRGVTTHWVSVTGNAVDEKQWDYSATSGADYVTTVKAPAPTGGSERLKTERKMFRASSGSLVPWGFDDARAGKPKDELVTRVNASDVPVQKYRRSLTDYTYDTVSFSSPVSGSATRNARPTKQVEILLDAGGVTAKAKTATLTYDTNTSFYGANLNVTETKSYDYADVSQTTAETAAISSIPLGTHLKTEKALFLLSDSTYSGSWTSYANRNLVALPTATWVETPGGVTTARTELVYDEAGYAPFTNSPAAGQWVDPATNYRGTATTTRRWLNVTHDASGNSTVNSYPSGQWLVTHTQTDVCGSVRKSWDARGKLSEVFYSSTYAYAYPTQTNTPPPNPTNANGTLGIPYATNQSLTTTATYDFSTGKPLTATEANGQTITNSYGNSFGSDPLQRLTKITRPTGGGETIFEYNDTPGSCACDLSVKTRTLQSTGPVNTYIEDYVFFDGLGRSWRTAHGEVGGKWSVKDTQYDNLGRVWKTANPVLTGVITTPNRGSFALVTTDVTTTAYDDLDRVLTVTTPDTSVITTTYSGNQVTVADQANGTANPINSNLPRTTTRRSVTDALGRLTQVVEAPGALNHSTNYTYDTLNNLVKVDQGGQLRYFMYDSAARLVRAKNPEQDVNGSLALSDAVTGNSSWTLKYIYDENGNLTKRTDARGTTATYRYDDLNRNRDIGYAGGAAAATPVVERYYDGATLGKGKLWKTISYNAHPQNGAQLAYQYNEVTVYDAVGRPTNGGQWFFNSSSQWVTYPYARSYDLASHVTGQTYPSNRTVSYSYGADGRLSGFSGTLSDGGPRTYADTMSYNAAGQLLQERFVTSTNLHHTMQYNKRFQMWDNRLGTTVGGWNRGALFTYYSVTARNSGNPAAEASGNNGNVWMQEHYIATDDAYSSYTIFRDVYEYDDLNRVKEDNGSQKSTTNVWTSPHKQSFNYDQWGNRTINSGQTWGTNINNIVFTPNTANNRFTQLGYDAAGNVTSDTVTGAGARAYDAENRMVQAAIGGGYSYYGYDGNGKRVRRITSSGEVWYVYGFDGELLAEYPVNGAASTPQKEYGYRNGQMLVVGGCDGVRWLVQDHLGSPRIEVDATGGNVRRHDYLPFGEELTVGMGNGSLRSTTNGYAIDCVSQRFTSKERDAETGLDFFGARYYGSTQGRFTSVDPGRLGKRHLTNPQKWNRYAYTINNPLRYFDPDGMEEIEIIFRTFIPAKTVQTPDGRTFEGDGRKMGDPGTFRTEQRITIETDPNKSGGHALVSKIHNVGFTREILSDGSVLQKRANGDTLTAVADYQVDNMGKQSSVKVNLQGNEGNPLVKFAPGITYDINIHVQSEGPEGAAIVTVYGEHDGFPGYELLVARPETGDSSAKLIVGYDPSGKATPLALFPPLDAVMQKTEKLLPPEKKKQDQ